LTGSARAGPVGTLAARAYPAVMPEGIFGRDAELNAVSGFLAGLSAAPSALVLAGTAGAGKTTLLREAAEQAAGRGYTVLRTLPARSDMRLAFAGLADLLGSRLDEILLRLPAPQRRALGVALLVEDAPQVPPDPHVIAAGFRTALLALAASAPVVVVIDDIQWLDAPTAAAAGFVLRRLARERVGLLCAQRTEAPGGDLPLELDRAGLRTEVLPLAGLSLGALHRLLRTRLGLIFSHPTLRRIHGESAGNPFIALEIGRGLARRGITRVAGGPLPLPGTLTGLVGERLRELPASVTDALRAVALMPDAPLGRYLAAGVQGSDLDAAVLAGVLEATAAGCGSPTRCWRRRSLAASRLPGSVSCTPLPRTAHRTLRRKHGTGPMPRTGRRRRSPPGWTGRLAPRSFAVPRPPPRNCWSSPPRSPRPATRTTSTAAFSRRAGCSPWPGRPAPRQPSCGILPRSRRRGRSARRPWRTWDGTARTTSRRQPGCWSRRWPRPGRRRR